MRLSPFHSLFTSPFHSKSYAFFASPEDIRAVVDRVGAGAALCYFECGLFDDAVRPALSLRESPELGNSHSGDANLEPSYLVFACGSKLNVRPVPQRKGGLKHAVDQQANAASIFSGQEVNMTTQRLLLGC